MKKAFILFLSQTVFLFMNCLGQETEQPYMYLTGYTIPKKTNTIGSVRLSGNEIKSVTIEGEHTTAFKVNKNHELVVRPGKLQSGPAWFDITLNVKTSTGQLSRTFRIVKDDFIRNKVIAHRGAWKNTGSPENSIAALKHAITMGCEGSEFDVHMSADSLPLINHDNSIQGVSIAKTNSSELLTMKLANGEMFPTLENYLIAGMEQTKTKLILEIKPSELGKESSIALTRKVVSLVEKLHAQAWVDYISFDYDACKEVMKLAPYAKVAYLRGDKTPTELAADKFFGLDYNFSVLQKNPDWLQDAKSRKLTINVWTVNDKPALEAFLKQNVDFITTNEPELLLLMVTKN
ncbi:MAG TPA: glycerophosphodiester phosphodiesterase family protein [Chryseolinea sp.]|nr:glycerophosphodiester phosphodiesterase family protein [Chryseolinea sp.]